MNPFRSPSWLAALPLLACGGPASDDPGKTDGADTDTDTDTDTDADTDADADTDTDADSDADTDTDADAESGADSGTGTGDTGVAVPPCAGFADRVSWPLPAGYPAATFEEWWDSSSADGVYWRWMDLDGDAAWDLVFARTSEYGVGATRWEFHPGSDEGFAGTAVEWDLPDEMGYRLQAFSDYTNDDERYSLFDLDGGGPDVVLHEWPGDERVGAEILLYYPNTGVGFSETALEWTLPDYTAFVGDKPFKFLTNGGTGSFQYGIQDDFDGDGRDDLLVWGDPNDASVGRDHWKVHLSTGGGFDAAGIEWSVPFTGLDPSGQSPSPGFVFWLADGDADGKVDLVVGRDRSDPDVGTLRWDVYANTGTGFSATPTAFAIPPDYGAFDFAGFGSTLSFWSSDLDGDRWVDLLVASDPADATVGADHWLLHRGGPGGFGPAEALPLPQGLPAGTFQFTNFDVEWMFTDATGDGVYEIVVVNDTDLTPELGQTEWWQFPMCP